MIALLKERHIDSRGLQPTVDDAKIIEPCRGLNRLSPYRAGREVNILAPV
jgi:hypothetical protein